ncbi:MAG: hypothetical protein WED10_13395 [Brumimicrobium sp.]
MWKLVVILFSFQLSFGLAQVKDTVIQSGDNLSYFKGKIKGGKKIGSWTEYDSLGTQLNTIIFLSDGKHCKVIPAFLNRGDSSEIEAYFIGNDIVFHGTYLIYLKDKNSKEEGEFKFGKKTGQWRYYENNILRSVHYYNPNGFTTINFNEVGKLMSSYKANENYKQDGFYIKLNDSSRIESIGNFKNGCKVGEWSYYSNGTLKSRGGYYPDCLTLKGMDTLFLVNKDGVKAKKLYSKSVLNSFVINDQILYLKDGCWKYYNEGSLFREELYEKGKLIKVKKVKR